MGGMTGYTLDSTADAWSQQVTFTIPCTYSHTYVLPSVNVVLNATFICDFVIFID